MLKLQLPTSILSPGSRAGGQPNAIAGSLTHTKTFDSRMASMIVLSELRPGLVIS